MNRADQMGLIEIFAENAAVERHHVKLMLQNERDFEQKKEKERRADKERERILEEVVAATTEPRELFQSHLEGYDTAIVDALTDNERELDEVRRRRETFEASAYRLQDGRMVFKTDDGKSVVDQNNKVLSRDTVDPESIPDSLPRDGDYRAAKSAEKRVQEEREEIHAFQTRVDDARQTSESKTATGDQLKSLDAELHADMPAAVKQKYASQHPDQNAAGPLPSDPLPATSPRVEGLDRKVGVSTFAPQ